MLLAGRRTMRAMSFSGSGSHAACRRHATVVHAKQQRAISNSGHQQSYAVPKSPTPTLSVLGSDKRFPVRRVYCVGSNYRLVGVHCTVCAFVRIYDLAVT